MTEAHPKFHFVTEDRGDYLLVTVTGKMVEREEMLAYQKAIADAMKPEHDRRVIVDGRGAERPLIELRAEMWTWMSESGVLRRIALLANEAKTQKRIARTADINRMLVSGFPDLEDAEEWVRRGS